MIELLNLLLVPAAALLWYLGGYGYGDDGIPDEGLPKLGKAYRRYVWPLLATLALTGNGVGLVNSALVGVGLAGVNSLGYGESKSWGYRCLVGALLGAPAMVLNPTLAYPLATLLTFIPLYKLSLKYNWMVWHVVEAATGAAQAVTIVALLLHRVYA